MREVIKEYEGERLVRTIERNFELCGTGPRPETQAKLQAMEQTLNELDAAVKALDIKWMKAITQQRDSLLKVLVRQHALDLEPVKKAQEGYVKEVQSLRASLFQLEKGKVARLKDQLQKLRAAVPVLAAVPIQAAKPGLPAAPVQEAAVSTPTNPNPVRMRPDLRAWLEARIEAARQRQAEPQPAKPGTEPNAKPKAGPFVKVGAGDTLVRVYALRRGQFRVRYFENGKRISKDTTDREAAVMLANLTSANLERQRQPIPKPLPTLLERLKRLSHPSGSTGHDGTGNIPAGQEGAGEVPGAAGGGDKPGQPT